MLHHKLEPAFVLARHESHALLWHTDTGSWSEDLRDARLYWDRGEAEHERWRVDADVAMPHTIASCWVRAPLIRTGMRVRVGGTAAHSAPGP